MADETHHKNKSALVLYLCNGNCFSKEAIDKLVFFVDLISYVKYGVSATDFTYRKLAAGAYPVEASSIRNLLVEKELLREIKRESALVYHFYYTPTENVDFGKVIARLGLNVTNIADLVSRVLGDKTNGELEVLCDKMKPWAGAGWNEVLSLKLLATDLNTTEVLLKYFNLE